VLSEEETESGYTGSSVTFFFGEKATLKKCFSASHSFRQQERNKKAPPGIGKGFFLILILFLSKQSKKSFLTLFLFISFFT
jgi:hypothetical protein